MSFAGAWTGDVGYSWIIEVSAQPAQPCTPWESDGRTFLILRVLGFELLPIAVQGLVGDIDTDTAQSASFDIRQGLFIPAVPGFQVPAGWTLLTPGTPIKPCL